jgi:Tfp pilus assembly protein PilN
MASPNSIDLNNPPEQYQSRRLPRRAMILWLVVIGFATFFLPLYLVSASIHDDNARLEDDLQSIQQALTTISSPAPEIQELMDTLAQLQKATNEIEAAYSTIAAGHTDWPAVMAVIGNYNPAQLTLTSLTHADSRIVLNGRATDSSVVAAYAHTLEESQLFSRVVVQSMKTIATPFVTPGGTESPETTITPTGTLTTTPTVAITPTPGPGDEHDTYEIDDFQHKDIILGQPQSHNFYPVYDVDKVKFLAKAGRRYRVYTFDLAPGVDTFLTVSVAGTSYTNDDRQPGDLGSEIEFQVGPSRDVEAFIKVTNRGQYSPDMWYQITVEEVIPTPTPMPTPTPTSTPTAIPTDTPVPADTPTPTPDLRDGYEPDDPDPKPIAVGETQTHNFYPDNDADGVEFLAKAGRYYRVSTSELALGVDTSLTVSVDETTYTNDDRQPGDLSSEIEFQVEISHDAEALIKVTNRGQYGPDKWYQITVEEVIPTPTPTPTITVTTPPSSRLPGLALLMPHPVQMMAEPSVSLSSPPTGRGKGALDALNSEAVEFVIVLELKVESP